MLEEERKKASFDVAKMTNILVRFTFTCHDTRSFSLDNATSTHTALANTLSNYEEGGIRLVIQLCLNPIKISFGR